MALRAVALLLAVAVVLLVAEVGSGLKVIHPFALRRQFITSFALFGAPPLTTRDTTANLVVAMPLHLCGPRRTRRRCEGRLS